MVTFSDKPRLVIFTDPGMDNDDEVMFVLLASLAHSEDLSPLAIITSRAPTAPRAKLAKGTFDSLNISIRVAAGSDESTEKSSHDILKDVPYVPGDFNIPHANKLLHDVLDKAPKKSIDLLVVAPFTDLANYIELHPTIVEQAVRSVAVMAGARQSIDSSFFIPDDSSNTHSDLKSAKFVYDFVQRNHIPMLFFSRHAAYNCPFAPSLYESLHATQHPVGTKLYRSAKTTLQRLWENVNKSEIDRVQSGIPVRCDKTWFGTTFGISNVDSLTIDINIWDHVHKVFLYDPLALIAAIPKFRNNFYRSKVVEIDGTKHMLIGEMAGDVFIKDPRKLTTFIENALLNELGKQVS